MQFRQAGLQALEFLLLVGNLLLQIVELGLSRGIVGVIGLRIVTVVFQRLFALKQIEIVLVFLSGKLRINLV